LGAQVGILDAAFVPYSGITATYCTYTAKPSDGSCVDEVTVYEEEIGKFKVPSLRNLEKTAPYGHNGFFVTLEEIVNFYNTRDVGSMWAGFVPEVPKNVNIDELGNLGLSADQEAKIVLFLKTLTDP
jgi:cytochrome c peroxidase